MTTLSQDHFFFILQGALKVSRKVTSLIFMVTILENETKTKWPRQKTGLLWVSCSQRAMSQSEWLEAMRGSRSVGLQTTVVALLSWAGFLFFPPATLQGCVDPSFIYFFSPHAWVGSLLLATSLRRNFLVALSPLQLQCYTEELEG